MTIGIGGWGSRRKPMAVVRAICRSDLTDLTVVAYGGPDVGLLCATGKVRKVVCGFVTLDSIALDPHWRAARQHGRSRSWRSTRACSSSACRRRPGGCPSCPPGPGSGSDVLTHQPGPAPGALPLRRRTARIWPTRPTPTSSWSPCRPSTSMPPSSTPTGPTPPATARSSAPTPSSTRCSSARPSGASSPPSASWTNGDAGRRGPPPRRVPIHRMLTDGVAEAPGGAHFTANPPDYGRDEAFQKEYAAVGRRPGRVGGVRQPLRLRRARTSTRPTWRSGSEG